MFTVSRSHLGPERSDQNRRASITEEQRQMLCLAPDFLLGTGIHVPLKRFMIKERVGNFGAAYSYIMHLK